jgi:hypothetical protein
MVFDPRMMLPMTTGLDMLLSPPTKAEGECEVSSIVLRPDDAPPRPHKPDQLGAMDEIIATGASIHIERLDDSHVWAKIETPGRTVRVSIWAKGGKVYFGAEEE